MFTKRNLKIALIAGVAFFALIQLVPYGRDHSNPPATQNAMISTAGRQVIQKGCEDCHTNLTDWRWYSNIAPASWLVENDAQGGRKHLNFSEWNKPQPPLNEVIHQISSGGMPPWQYKLGHPHARLDKKDRDILVTAIKQLYAQHPPTIRQGRPG